jgi:hypothetical protein
MKMLTTLLLCVLLASLAYGQATNAPAQSQGQSTNTCITIKDTILEEHLQMGVDLLSGSTGQPSIVLTLEKHPDVRFIVSSKLGFKSGLIPPDGHYDGKKIWGWKIELTYDANLKREISKIAHYEAVSLTVIDKTTPEKK